MKSQPTGTRIPKGDWGRFCWECYLRGFQTITGRMTEHGEVIVVSGVPKNVLEELLQRIRATYPRFVSVGPALTAGERWNGGMPDGEWIDAYEYYSRNRFKGVRAKRDCKQGELVSAEDLEVIEGEEENGRAASDES